MTTTKITVGNTIAANLEKVWDYWTQPEHITRWNFAGDDWHCPRAENDLRKGGKYSARMEAKDGSMGFDFEAVYDEVSPNRIIYTMSDGRQATTSFEEAGGSTRVTTTFDAEKTNPVEMQRAGWQQIMDNFKDYVERE